jgi:hypothetical protein
LCHLNHTIYEQIADAGFSRLHRRSNASAIKGFNCNAFISHNSGQRYVFCYFDTNENLNAAFPSMKEPQQSVAAKFEAKTDAQKAVISSQSDFGVC